MTQENWPRGSGLAWPSRWVGLLAGFSHARARCMPARGRTAPAASTPRLDVHETGQSSCGPRDGQPGLAPRATIVTLVLRSAVKDSSRCPPILSSANRQVSGNAELGSRTRLGVRSVSQTSARLGGRFAPQGPSVSRQHSHECFAKGEDRPPEWERQGRLAIAAWWVDPPGAAPTRGGDSQERRPASCGGRARTSRPPNDAHPCDSFRRRPLGPTHPPLSCARGLRCCLRNRRS